MSSDAIADLAGSLGKFSASLREAMERHPVPPEGSPAEKEAEGEPFAGDWGRYPSRDIYAAALLATASCADHLAGTASVLLARNAPFSPYTLIRAAAESAAIGCYLTDRNIDARERMRRNMNFRLDALCEQLTMLKGFIGDDAKRKADWTGERIAAFGRTAANQGFTFKAKNGPGRPACLTPPMPSAMALMAAAVDREQPELGLGYQRHLSSVAHSKLHGLTRFLQRLPGPDGGDRHGQAAAQINVSAQSLAIELLAGPLCAASLVEGLGWYGGWDSEGLSENVIRMLHTWGRIAGVPYPGPAAVA
jgi:hypothetical protein